MQQKLDLNETVDVKVLAIRRNKSGIEGRREAAKSAIMRRKYTWK